MGHGHRWRRSRRVGVGSAVALPVAGVLALGGGGAIAWAATHQQHAARPGPAAAGVLLPASGPVQRPAQAASAVASPRPLAAPAALPVHLPRSTPVSLTIPAIGVRSPLQGLGRNADGTVQVPQPGPHYNEAAWYTGSPTPGELGASVLEGHVDSKADGPSVFFRLGALKPGARIYVREADGAVAVFKVNAVRIYLKSSFPDSLVYGPTDYAALRLITCGGSFDPTTGSYLSNVVVYAYLLPPTPTPRADSASATARARLQAPG